MKAGLAEQLGLQITRGFHLASCAWPQGWVSSVPKSTFLLFSALFRDCRNGLSQISAIGKSPQNFFHVSFVFFATAEVQSRMSLGIWEQMITSGEVGTRANILKIFCCIAFLCTQQNAHWKQTWLWKGSNRKCKNKPRKEVNEAKGGAG